MWPNFVHLLPFAASALAQTSPLFRLVSTAQLPTEVAGVRINPPVNDVQHLLWQSLASCPTKHYAVVVEPSTLSYTSAYIPNTPNVRSTFTAHEIDGRVNIVHVINTILMDCLHHGVLRVEELNTKVGLPSMTTENIRKSIMYARMSDIDQDMPRDIYMDLVQHRQTYVEQILKNYFDNEDYTLIYIREEQFQGKEVFVGHDDGAEIPLVGEHKM